MAGPTDTSTGPDDPAYHEAVGRAIRVLRTERGMERKELAAASGLSYAYLSEIETGRKRASSKALYLIAEALGLRPSELLALGDRYAERDASAASVVMEQSLPEPASPAPEAVLRQQSASAPSAPPPPAAFAAPPPAPVAGSGRQRWRWFERDAERASAAAASPAADEIDAPLAQQRLAEPASAGGSFDPRGELIERIEAAAARLEDDDLAVLAGLAERLGRDRPGGGATR
jgi:transcriptional regulator with XRE-family HTH domain